MTHLSAQQKKDFRTIGHALKPIITISDNGLSDNITAEISRALNDHELIKVKVNTADREQKHFIINEICRQHEALLVQSIGKIALLYRPAKEPNPKLSNILRQQK